MPNLGFGTTLTWDGEVVAKLTAINGIELSMGTVDATTHQSADSYKEVLPGLIDPGEVSVEGYFDYTDTAGQQAMITDFNARSLKTGIITFPSATGTTWTFSGYITRIKIGDAPTEGLIAFSATMKPTGKPTLAVTSVVGMSAIGFDNDVTFMPTFAIGTYEYVITHTNGESSTIVTPVDATDGEVITITANGVSQVVTTGEASTAITLSATAITDIVVVISKTACAPKTYTFHCAVLAA